ncbi:hypothetical protein LN030_28660, partial [Klebsiella pneumoniae]|nr:hypothetical protein [Klebsiella pneumoniae]
WVHVQLHQQKGMISLSPPTICNSALFKVLHQVNNELHDLLDSLENHTPLVRKNADELIALLLLFTRQVGQSRTDLI